VGEIQMNGQSYQLYRLRLAAAHIPNNK
jgi:hypothetical protein